MTKKIGHFLKKFEKAGFWALWTKNLRFFGARSLSKFVFIVAESLRIFLVWSAEKGWSAENWCHKIIPKGDPLVGDGVESLKKGAPANPKIRFCPFQTSLGNKWGSLWYNFVSDWNDFGLIFDCLKKAKMVVFEVYFFTRILKNQLNRVSSAKFLSKLYLYHFLSINNPIYGNLNQHFHDIFDHRSKLFLE